VIAPVTTAVKPDISAGTALSPVVGVAEAAAVDSGDLEGRSSATTARKKATCPGNVLKVAAAAVAADVPMGAAAAETATTARSPVTWRVIVPSNAKATAAAAVAAAADTVVAAAVTTASATNARDMATSLAIAQIKGWRALDAANTTESLLVV